MQHDCVLVRRRQSGQGLVPSGGTGCGRTNVLHQEKAGGGNYRQRSLDEYVLRFSFLSKMVSEVITRGWGWCTSQIGISRGLFTFIF